MTIPELSPERIVERLQAARTPGPAALSFDGDGTLWTGDVAEDVFCHAVDNELLHAAPTEALIRAAGELRVDRAGSASRIARQIFDAYLAGRYPELEVCEVMTWCFAGYALEELGELAARVLAQKALDQRLHQELAPIFAWARREGVRTIVISASPRPIVEQAARRWGIEPHDIAASTPALDDARIAPRMHTPVPYAATKVAFGRELIGGARWLGAFGDSGFDADMLAAAAVPVAVRPKPSLRERAASIRDLVMIRADSASL